MVPGAEASQRNQLAPTHNSIPVVWGAQHCASPSRARSPSPSRILLTFDPAFSAFLPQPSRSPARSGDAHCLLHFPLLSSLTLCPFQCHCSLLALLLFLCVRCFLDLLNHQLHWTFVHHFLQPFVVSFSPVLQFLLHDQSFHSGWQRSGRLPWLVAGSRTFDEAPAAIEGFLPTGFEHVVHGDLLVASQLLLEFFFELHPSANHSHR